MAQDWTKEENIRNASVWLARKVALIEEKHDLIESQRIRIQQNGGTYQEIKKVYRGSVYWVELGETNERKIAFHVWVLIFG